MSYFERNNEFKKHHGKVSAVASQKVMVELISKTGLDYKVRARGANEGERCTTNANRERYRLVH